MSNSKDVLDGVSNLNHIKRRVTIKLLSKEELSKEFKLENEVKICPRNIT